MFWKGASHETNARTVVVGCNCRWRPRWHIRLGRPWPVFPWAASRALLSPPLLRALAGYRHWPAVWLRALLGRNASAAPRISRSRAGSGGTATTDRRWRVVVLLPCRWRLLPLCPAVPNGMGARCAVSSELTRSGGHAGRPRDSAPPFRDSQAASSTRNSICNPAAVAMFTSASSPNRLILPRIRSDTRG